MRINAGPNTYDWIDNWDTILQSQSDQTDWAHHGLVITKSGDIVTYQQSNSAITILDVEGHIKQSWSIPVTDAHGITMVEEDNTEYLWIADNGAKRLANLNYEYPSGNRTGQVLKVTMSGELVMRIEKPDVEVYQKEEYSPTWIAVNEKRHGGNGDIWVADGYGASYVHRYDQEGSYLSSINGGEGKAGVFNCPHAIFIDRRRQTPELYVADRGNARIQVYDMNGLFQREFGSDFLTSPSGFATHRDQMIIAELKGRLTILDLNDSPIGYLGSNQAVFNNAGWPNSISKDGKIMESELLEKGKFNSPHGIAIDNNGNIYISEWLIGGRHTKLVKI